MLSGRNAERTLCPSACAKEAFKAAKEVPLEKIQGVIKQTKDAIPDSVPNPLRELLPRHDGLIYDDVDVPFLQVHKNGHSADA